ncbi:MAG: hypothetical protein ACJAS4_000262 [Bacteriovoracaceae bacterium]|jgi:hypothetical protein
MKGLITAAALYLLANTASAYTLGIVDIDEPITSTDSYVAYGSDGRMYEISQDNLEVVELAKEAMASRYEVEVEFSNSSEAEDILELRNTITKISLTTNEVDEAVQEAIDALNKEVHFNGNASLLNSYVTDVSSQAQANQLFLTQRRDTKTKSQCFNRAHVWSWELNKKSIGGRSIQTGKIWIYFTKKYIRDYKYKWWFHISPYITVNGELRVMDRSYLSQPSSEKTWTDKFISSKQNCPEIYKYSDYANNQFSSHCYVMKSSVFYWQPWQLENIENRNQGRSEWSPSELKAAYRNAIGWFSRVP